MNKTLFSIAQSWCALDSPINPTDTILSWVAERNRTVSVEIHKVLPKENDVWFYDQEEGCIRNQSRSFFTITGYQQITDNSAISQPIILQQEIGYLGIICQDRKSVV